LPIFSGSKNFHLLFLLKPNFFKINRNYAKELAFGVRIGVKASSFDLHMARAREVPY
jgi:hypothetical protein